MKKKKSRAGQGEWGGGKKKLREKKIGRGGGEGLRRIRKEQGIGVAIIRFRQHAEKKKRGGSGRREDQKHISVMVKKSVEWHATTDGVTTPSQIRCYIESCKEWLLSQLVEDGECEENISKQLPPLDLTNAKIGNIGLVTENIQTQHVFDCFFCEKTCRVPDGHVVNANPFTRSQSMLVCGNCVHLIS